MICDYTMLLGAYGGSFLDDDGKPAFQTGGGVQALDYMVNSIEAGLTNPNSKEYPGGGRAARVLRTARPPSR